MQPPKMSPILAGKDYAAKAVFTPENGLAPGRPAYGRAMTVRSRCAMEVALVNGMFLRMTASPAGSTLVLLHAFGDSGLAFTPLFATPLADRFRLVAVDLAGFGASPPRDGVRTIADHAKAVADLVASLPERGPVGLVAHSMASMIAVEAVPYLGARFAGLFQSKEI
jgi:pimeloyl-ACP methyl ester carboxylesterase